MRGHAVFGEAVHVLGADLDLHGSSLGADDHGMQGLIAVRLGIGDVIVEFLGDMQPGAVDLTQHRIAGRDILDDDADGMQVEELFERHILTLDFLVDAVKVFGAAEDSPGDAGGFELFPQFEDEVLDEMFAGRPVAGQ